jgi:hypothetical protein
VLRGVGLSFIMRGIIEMQVPEEIGNPRNNCEFLRKILSPVQGVIPSAEDGKNP